MHLLECQFLKVLPLSCMHTMPLLLHSGQIQCAGNGPSCCFFLSSNVLPVSCSTPVRLPGLSSRQCDAAERLRSSSLTRTPCPISSAAARSRHPSDLLQLALALPWSIEPWPVTFAPRELAQSADCARSARAQLDRWPRKCSRTGRRRTICRGIVFRTAHSLQCADRTVKRASPFRRKLHSSAGPVSGLSNTFQTEQRSQALEGCKHWQVDCRGQELAPDPVSWPFCICRLQHSACPTVHSHLTYCWNGMGASRDKDIYAGLKSLTRHMPFMIPHSPLPSAVESSA